MPCLSHHSAIPAAPFQAAAFLSAPVQPAFAKRIFHDIKDRSHIAERSNAKVARNRFIF